MTNIDQVITTGTQILVNGLLFGSMYGISAIGLSLIFGTMGIIFIAQGTMIILAAYLVYLIKLNYSFDPLLVSFLITPLFFILGGCIYFLLFRKVADKGKNPNLLLAFGLMIMLESLISLFFSPNTKAIITGYTTIGISIMGIRISLVRSIAFVISISTTIALLFF